MGVGVQMKCNISSFHIDDSVVSPLTLTPTTRLYRGPEVPADEDEVQLGVQSASRVLGGEDDAVRMLPGRQ